jgi:hypothetical protein
LQKKNNRKNIENVCLIVHIFPINVNDQLWFRFWGSELLIKMASCLFRLSLFVFNNLHLKN